MTYECADQRLLGDDRHQHVLCAARSVADHALRIGVLKRGSSVRPVYSHMGAALADSVLQAGLRYTSVVMPRIRYILDAHPNARTLSALVEVLEAEGSSKFLQWKHGEKLARFENLVRFLLGAKIIDTRDLGEALRDQAFRKAILGVRGVGPKTTDYLACVVGVDCIAVDRHVRSFADDAGLTESSYDFLRDTFGFAADLLAVSRREFDSRIWQHQASGAGPVANGAKPTEATGQAL